MLAAFKHTTLRAFLVVSCLFTMHGYSSDPWNPDPATSINASFHSNSPSVFSSCDSSGNFLATWLNTSDFFPYYSIYTHNTSLWSTPLAITSAVAGASGTMVFSAFDSSTGKFLVTWQNGTSVPTYNAPFFSIYNGGSWTVPASIAGISYAITSNVFCSSDSNGHFLATWCPTPGSLPHYAIYTEGSGSWGFDASLASGAGGDVVSSYDSLTGNFLVTWADSGNGSYSIYNVNTAIWTTPAQIPSASPNGNVFSSSDAQGNFLVTWFDSNGHAAYSIYDSNTLTWSSITTITNSLPDSDVTSSFDSSTGNFLITWQDSNTNTPYYSIYNPSASPQYTAQSQVAPTTPLANANGADIFSSCYSGSGSFLVTFTSLSTIIPSYTFYNGTLPPPPPSPVQAPDNFRGKQKVNNFGVVSERYNALSWESSIGADSYRLYRNGLLIATLGANSTSYDDHNQPKASQSYTLTAVGAGGAVASATISVGK